MYKRIIDKKLAFWAKKEGRKPLILRGARQVGKTTAVRNFAKHFDNYIELNLDIHEEKKLFEIEGGFDELVNAIFFFKKKSQKKGRTLIFIDEIQNSVQAIKQLRYFYENRPDLYLIAAGSLLETLIDTNVSFPVGRVEYLYMYPFTFEEFLWASAKKEELAVFNQIPIPDYAKNTFQKYFDTYTLIGGMPEIIVEYLKNNDLVALLSLYESLITTYLDDVEKYATNKNQASIIRFIIERSFYQAGQRIKFASFGNSNYTSNAIKEAFIILEKALILNIVYPTSKVLPPIESNFRKSPKLILLDTGLVNFFAGHQKAFFKVQDIINLNSGYIAEHIVAQELQAYKNSHLHKVNFWIREKKQSNAEVDFILHYEDMLIPVEVKSGKTGRLRSLHQFIDSCPHKYAIRIYSGKFNIEESTTIAGKTFFLLNLPFFLISRINDYIQLLVDFEQNPSAKL